MLVCTISDLIELPNFTTQLNTVGMRIANLGIPKFRTSLTSERAYWLLFRPKGEKTHMDLDQS